MNIICRIDQSFKEPHILFPETWEWDHCATWLSERDIEGTFVSLCEEGLCFIVADSSPSDPSGGSTSHPDEKTPSSTYSTPRNSLPENDAEGLSFLKGKGGIL